MIYMFLIKMVLGASKKLIPLQVVHIKVDQGVQSTKY